MSLHGPQGFEAFVSCALLVMAIETFINCDISPVILLGFLKKICHSYTPSNIAPLTPLLYHIKNNFAIVPDIKKSPISRDFHSFNIRFASKLYGATL
jgi:hypothetical protein